MVARKPLAKGDDGSGIRYPDRSIIWDPEKVPAALQAPQCSACKALSWTVDHFEGDSDSPLLCSDCADQAYDRG